MIVEYPINYTIQRVPVGKFLGINILCWSTVLCCHALCFSYPALVTVRTLLGIFEAVCQPAFLIMSSVWYKREEQAQVVNYWYMMNGMQQIVGGLLAYCFSLIHHPSYKTPKGVPEPGTAKIRSWQAIFITYGMFSFLWGVFVLIRLPGKSDINHPVSTQSSDSLQIRQCEQSVLAKKTRSSWLSVFVPTKLVSKTRSSALISSKRH